jgi:hypothetical protein
MSLKTILSIVLIGLATKACAAPGPRRTPDNQKVDCDNLDEFGWKKMTNKDKSDMLESNLLSAADLDVVTKLVKCGAPITRKALQTAYDHVEQKSVHSEYYDYLKRNAQIKVRLERFAEQNGIAKSHFKKKDQKLEKEKEERWYKNMDQQGV